MLGAVVTLCRAFPTLEPASTPPAIQCSRSTRTSSAAPPSAVPVFASIIISSSSNHTSSIHSSNNNNNSNRIEDHSLHLTQWTAVRLLPLLNLLSITTNVIPSTIITNTTFSITISNNSIYCCKR